VQPPVQAVLIVQQLGVPPLLHDAPVVDDQDPVGAVDRGQPVRDDDRGAPLKQPIERLRDALLRDRIEWPPDSVTPPSPSGASSPRGSATSSSRTLAAAAAPSTSSSVASSRP
jgi:hypothetical protein